MAFMHSTSSDGICHQPCSTNYTPSHRSTRVSCLNLHAVLTATVGLMPPTKALGLCSPPLLLSLRVPPPFPFSLPARADATVNSQPWLSCPSVPLTFAAPLNLLLLLLPLTLTPCLFTALLLPVLDGLLDLLPPRPPPPPPPPPGLKAAIGVSIAGSLCPSLAMLLLPATLRSALVLARAGADLALPATDACPSL